MQLEMAYDTLLMQAMKKRLRGEVAGQSVRFADVPKRRAAGTVSNVLHLCLLFIAHYSCYTACLLFKYVQAAKQAIKRLPGGIEVRQTPKDDLVKLSAGFAVLGGWSLLQVLLVMSFSDRVHAHHTEFSSFVQPHTLAGITAMLRPRCKRVSSAHCSAIIAL